MNVIKIKNLCKEYNVVFGIKNRTLRDFFSYNKKNISANNNNNNNNNNNKLFDNRCFYALHNININIKKGDIVGVVGANGAGKSTLLKIISRITPPTKGKITINGSVASLLEIGTGFHQELTGRENIFLNGAILGMNKREIVKKLEDIIDFSGIRKFLDTPIKKYSSGMQMRLAFSIAAFLDPDILLIDEVLSVGDIDFQKKCLGKMDEITKKFGKTILFVSHNLDSIQRICNNCILIQNGEILMFDRTDKVVEKYLRDNNIVAEQPLLDRKDRKGSGELKIIGYKLKNLGKNQQKNCAEDYELEIELQYISAEEIKNVLIAVGVNNIFGKRLITLSNDFNSSYFNVKAGKGIFNLKIARIPLKPGKYYVTTFVQASNGIIDNLENAFSFNVLADNSLNYNIYPSISQGEIVLKYFWQKHESY